MNIRPATLDDVEGIIDLHTRSVRGLCTGAYSPEQIAAWTGRKDLQRYRERIQRDPTYVAEQEGTIIGYVRIFIPTSEFASIFVDPDFARMGLGNRLFNIVLKEARKLGLTHFWLDASLNAVPFYEKHGFQKRHDRMHDMGGVFLPCVRMELNFNDTTGQQTED